MIYDLLIIGGGPAGLSAAIYAGWTKLSVLVLEKLSVGGAIVVSKKVKNYPGFPEGISGAELGGLMEEQARQFGAEITWGTVTSFEDKGEIKVIKSGKDEYKAKTVLICTGTSHRSLGVPGEEKFKGRGISYCAICDAPFFKEKEVVVVGGGNSALQEAVSLTKFASKVYIVHNSDQLKAEKPVQEEARNNDKIVILYNTVVKEILGEDLLEKVVLINNETGEEWALEVSGVFPYIGVQPNTYFLENSSVELDDQGFIITNENMETSVPGIYAAGDVRQKEVPQIVVAAAEGAIAATMVKKYLKERGGKEENG